jgi:predicted CXXCH cytochrome family protein
MHSTPPKPGNRFLRAALFGALGIALAATLISCASVERAVVIPPHIDGATFIGDQTCAECHQNITKDFTSATHSHIKALGTNADEIGCESCHGPGSKHKESGGLKGTIINPRRNSETCFQCHMDMKAKFSAPSHHPVEDGKVSCADCHNPHKGQAVVGGGTALATEQDTCTKCHLQQRGPFVFEHEALREGCTTCHSPHGSVNEKMLVQRNSNLCLKCHFQTQGVTPGLIYIGGQEHSARLSQGTCWTSGCHEAVHGSHINSSLRY